MKEMKKSHEINKNYSYLERYSQKKILDHTSTKLFRRKKIIKNNK